MSYDHIMSLLKCKKTAVNCHINPLMRQTETFIQD